LEDFSFFLGVGAVVEHGFSASLAKKDRQQSYETTIYVQAMT
jgi:hypothetical protein